MKRIMLLFLALVLSACSSVPRSELSQNQAKWKAAGIRSYRMSLFIGCFCGFTERMPLSVEVQDGQVISMTYSDGTPVSAQDIGMDLFSRFATIDKLFAELETGEASKADEVNVSYDPTYGFPQKVTVDRYKDAVDDEYSVEIRSFQPVK